MVNIEIKKNNNFSVTVLQCHMTGGQTKIAKVAEFLLYCWSIHISNWKWVIDRHQLCSEEFKTSNCCHGLWKTALSHNFQCTAWVLRWHEISSCLPLQVYKNIVYRYVISILVNTIWIFSVAIQHACMNLYCWCQKQKGENMEIYAVTRNQIEGRGRKGEKTRRMLG